MDFRTKVIMTKCKVSLHIEFRLIIHKIKNRQMEISLILINQTMYKIKMGIYKENYHLRIYINIKKTRIKQTLKKNDQIEVFS